jgi:hypothetical protein
MSRLSVLYKDPHVLGLMLYMVMVLYGLLTACLPLEDACKEVLKWPGLVLFFFVHIYNLFLFIKTIFILFKYPFSSFTRKEQSVLIIYTLINTLYIIFWLIIYVMSQSFNNLRFS